MPSPFCFLKRFLLILTLFPLQLLAADSYLTKLKLWFDTPCQSMDQALPIGNGTFGGLAWGSSAWDSILLFDVQKRLNFGTLVVGTNMSLDGATGYRRQLDIARGLYSTEYVVGGNKISRECFASVPDRLIGMRIRTDSVNVGQKLEVLLRLLSPYKDSLSYMQDGIFMSGKVEPKYMTAATDSADHEFHLQLLVKHDGKADVTGYAMRITDATEVQVYLLYENDADALNLAKMRLEYKDFAKVRFNQISYYRNRFEPFVEGMSIPDADDSAYTETLRDLYEKYLKISAIPEVKNFSYYKP